ncbi:acylphosphatase [Archaeoglobales archaeon]|nr:MAG: acylphosphatase [Archaeoglobales archaeon]
MQKKITITGRVHDVGYRLFLLEEADRLFIPHFDAKNVKINGKEILIVLVGGDENQINEFIEFVKTERPELSNIEDIIIEDYKGRIRDIKKFRANFSISQLSKIVQYGAKMLEKQDLMIEKQDETIRVIKEESEATRQDLGSKIDKVGEKIDYLRSDMKEYMEKRFKELSDRINMIEEKLKKAGII